MTRKSDDDGKVTQLPKGKPRASTAISPTSERGLALRLAIENADSLRYVPQWGRWLYWTGTHWKRATISKAWHAARLVIDEMVKATPLTDSQAARLHSAKTENAVVDIAKRDPRIEVEADIWDPDPWLLNTPRATIDLRAMKMHEHRPEDLITKITTVEIREMPTPLWDRFLREIMADDEEMIAYLYRVLGYSLTGSTREQVMFFAYGKGSNGKGVLFSTVTGILGRDYTTASSIDTFTDSGLPRHTTELAKLAGARIVTATETEQGKAWAEAKLKALTGGDRISARFMRQDDFEFTPAFKLFVSGNHKPAVKSPDEAMRRRMQLIPFTVTIPASRRDPELVKKLEVERPGILAKMVDGCAQYLDKGLAPPAAVTSATDSYLAEEDAVARWLGQCIDNDPQSRVPLNELFPSWKRWAEANGEPAGPSKALAGRLDDHGLERGSLLHGYPTWLRIRLKPPEETRRWDDT